MLLLLLLVVAVAVVASGGGGEGAGRRVRMLSGVRKPLEWRKAGLRAAPATRTNYCTSSNLDPSPHRLGIYLH